MKEEIKYQGRYLKVTEETIDNYVWEKVYLPASLVVFAINQQGQFLLVNEYRPHENTKTRLKFVTGHLEKEEDILACANRELQEEAGFAAKKLEIFHAHESSGTLNSLFYFVLASELYPSKLPNPDGEHTILSSKFFSAAEITQMLKNGQLPWSLASIGFFMLSSHFPQN